jgi:hypothetical protein
MKLSILTLTAPQTPYKLHTPQHNATISMVHSGLDISPTYMAELYGPLYMHGFFKVAVVNEDRGSDT